MLRNQSLVVFGTVFFQLTVFWVKNVKVNLIEEKGDLSAVVTYGNVLGLLRHKCFVVMS